MVFWKLQEDFDQYYSNLRGFFSDGESSVSYVENTFSRLCWLVFMLSDKIVGRNVHRIFSIKTLTAFSCICLPEREWIRHQLNHHWIVKLIFGTENESETGTETETETEYENELGKTGKIEESRTDRNLKIRSMIDSAVNMLERHGSLDCSPSSSVEVILHSFHVTSLVNWKFIGIEIIFCS